ATVGFDVVAVAVVGHALDHRAAPGDAGVDVGVGQRADTPAAAAVGGIDRQVGAVRRARPGTQRIRAATGRRARAGRAHRARGAVGAAAPAVGVVALGVGAVGRTA